MHLKQPSCETPADVRQPEATLPPRSGVGALLWRGSFTVARESGPGEINNDYSWAFHSHLTRAQAWRLAVDGHAVLPAHLTDSLSPALF